MPKLFHLKKIKLVKPNKFSSKILFNYFLISFFSFLLLIFIIFITTSKIIIDQEMKNNRLLLAQTIESLDRNLKYISNLTSLIYYNQKVVDLLVAIRSEPLSEEENKMSTNFIEDFLFTLLNSRNDIVSVSFLYDNKIYYKYRVLMRSKFDGDFNDKIWYQSIRQANGKAVIIDEYSLPNTLKKRKVVTIGRLIKNADNNEELGTIVIDVDIDAFFSSVNNSGSLGEFVILNQRGDLLLGGDRLEQQFIAALKTASSAEEIKNIDSEEYLVLTGMSEVTGWEIMYYVERDKLLHNLNEIKRLVAATFAMIFLAAVVIFFLLIQKVSLRINYFLEKMRKFKNGDLNVRIQDNRNDELSSLSMGFNDMVVEIKNLIEKVYIVQIKQKEAELQGLKNQINPHFIYNTLESIQMFAVIKDQKELARMIALFGKLLRVGLNNSDDRITVREEADFIRMYLETQKIRYQDKFDFRMDIAEEALDKQIVKLILQPIVENAVYHGLEKKLGAGRLRITASCTDEALIFSVADDGVGIAEDELKQLNNRLSHADFSDRRSVGIRNVNERIKLYYGNEYGIVIESKFGQGTTVIIKLPFIDGF